MNTWKLTIKPESSKEYDSFDICEKKSLLGVGWSIAYTEKQASNIDEAKELVKEKFGKWPSAIKYLLEDVKEGDHVWIHQKGKYYLCKAKDEILFGKSIHKDFLSYDLGHARKAEWIKIPEEYVSGTIQRGTIAQRMIQKISISEKEQEVHNKIFNELSRNSEWQPVIDEDELSSRISKIQVDDLFPLMSPKDDFEDVISAYLQSQGWVLIKSTCFRSKPEFEFSMLNKKNKVCRVQVKSGKHPNCLRPSDYSQFVSNKNIIFLFSTHKNPYPGESINGIYTITHNEIYDWVAKNVWSLTMPLKLRLWMFLNEING